MIWPAARTSDDQVLFAGDPFAARQLLEEGFVEASGSPVIDILDTGLWMAQAGVAEPVGQSPVVAFGFLAVEQQGQPLAMVEFAGLGIVVELGESAGHAVQLEMPELVEGGMLQHDVSSVEVRLMEVVRAADVGVIDRRSVRGLSRCAALEIVLEDGSERGIGRGADLQGPFAGRFQPFAAMGLG